MFVSDAVEEAWRSSLLSDGEHRQLAPEMKEAVANVRKHQTAVSSFEARHQLEKYLTRHLFPNSKSSKRQPETPAMATERHS